MSRENFGKNLRAVRKALKLTQVEFAKPLGITGVYVSDLERGGSYPSEPVLRQIEEKYLVSRKFLDTGSGEMFGVKVQKGVPGVVALNEIPVLGRISAGFPNIAAEEVIEYISIPGTPENTFALKVKGRSMWPTLYDGDYVLFVENGDYRSEDVLVVLDEWGDAMIKRLKVRDGLNFLVSDNPEYPVVEPNENYRIIGKVVKVWRDIRF